MKREIAVGDIHGCYVLLKILIEDIIQYDPLTDKLIFLGDYQDRGAESADVIKYVSKLKNKNPQNIELLLGNHEEMAFKALSSDDQFSNENFLWLKNGGDATLKSFNNNKEMAKKKLFTFYEWLKPYYENDSYIFVHAGIPYKKTLKTASINELVSCREFSCKQDKTIICGHTIHKEITYYKKSNIICIDTGAFTSGILSAYDTVSRKIYRT